VFCSQLGFFSLQIFLELLDGLLLDLNVRFLCPCIIGKISDFFLQAFQLGLLCLNWVFIWWCSGWNLLCRFSSCLINISFLGRKRVIFRRRWKHQTIGLFLTRFTLESCDLFFTLTKCLSCLYKFLLHFLSSTLFCTNLFIFNSNSSHKFLVLLGQLRYQKLVGLSLLFKLLQSFLVEWVMWALL
jgi:hypothetical protein